MTLKIDSRYIIISLEHNLTKLKFEKREFGFEIPKGIRSKLLGKNLKNGKWTWLLWGEFVRFDWLK